MHQDVEALVHPLFLLPYGIRFGLSAYRIVHILRLDAVEHLIAILARLPTCHGQIVQKPVATVLRCCTRNVTFKFGNESECTLHEFYYVFGLQVATHKQIIAGETSQRSPRHDAVFPLCVVAQLSGSQMLNSVQSTRMQRRLTVGFLHANVESGDYIASYIVLTRNVYTAQQAVVIDCKAWYLLHIIYMI